VKNNATTAFKEGATNKKPDTYELNIWF